MGCAFLMATGGLLGTNPGLIVESLDAPSTSGGLRIHAGDVLLGWTLEKEVPANIKSGRFETIWDWKWFQKEIAPRGTLALLISRAGQHLKVDLDAETLKEVGVRPNMGEMLLASYALGLEKLEAGDVEGGTAIWFEMEGEDDLKQWLTLRAAEAYGRRGKYEKELELMDRAQAQVIGANARLCVFMIHSIRLWRLENLDSASKVASLWYEQSKLEPESLVFAGCLSLLGNLARSRGDFDLAEKYHESSRGNP